MLTLAAIQAAYPLTSMLDARGYAVRPVGGSFVESLLSAGYGFVNQVPDESGGVMAGEPTPFIPDGQQQSEMDLRMETAVNFTVKAVQNQIVLIRNEIGPAIVGLVKDVERALEDYSVSRIAALDIKHVACPKLVSNAAFGIMIADAKDLPGFTSNFPFTFGLRTGPEVVEMMKVGVASIDKDIELWAKERGYDFFSKVWTTFFSNVGGLPDFNKGLGVDEFETAMVVFMLSRNLIDNPQDNQRLSLSSYNDAMQNYRNQSARRLSIQINTYDSYVKNGFVVMDTFDNVTTVIEQTYNKFIEAGGTVEVLFGNAVAGGKYKTVGDLMSNAPKLLEEFRRYSALVKNNDTLNRTNNTRRFLNDFFAASLKGKDCYEKCVKAFKEELDDVLDSEFNDLYSVTTKVYCETMYPDTDAMEILLNTQAITKENPDLDLREARSLAIKKYVDRFVVSQLQIVPM
jgi:hypothetical protein